MQRFRISVVVVAVALFALPAVAHAHFHLQKANEVMLASATGDSSVQFVELFDGNGEPFPTVDGPYQLVIYNAAGNQVGAHTLSASGMASADSTASHTPRPYLISTAAADTALGVTGDETLDVALPKTAGQACYTAGGSAYSCITWGCITHFVSTVGTGSFHGAVPPNGKSAQRQSNDSIQIANPTPKATNVAGTSPTVCANPPYPGVTIPKQTVTVKNNKVPVTVKCPVKAKGKCVGKLTLKTAKKVMKPDGSKAIVTLGSGGFTIDAGKTKTVQVKLSKNGKFVMANHKSVKANASAKAHDNSGKSKTTSGKVTVKQSK